MNRALDSGDSEAFDVQFEHALAGFLLLMSKGRKLRMGRSVERLAVVC